MHTGPEEGIRSFLLGIALPLWVALLAVGFITGTQTKTRHGTNLGPPEGLGLGLFLLGMALFTHAFGFLGYRNRPAVKYGLFAAGTAFIIVGLCLLHGCVL